LEATRGNALEKMGVSGARSWSARSLRAVTQAPGAPRPALCGANREFIRRFEADYRAETPYLIESYRPSEDERRLYYVGLTGVREILYPLRLASHHAARTLAAAQLWFPGSSSLAPSQLFDDADDPLVTQSKPGPKASPDDGIRHFG
jgi:hypothetical protein